MPINNKIPQLTYKSGEYPAKKISRMTFTEYVIGKHNEYICAKLFLAISGQLYPLNKKDGIT